MKIYEISPDASEGRWVWFFTQEGQENRPLTWDQLELNSYYKRNPIIKIRRNTEQKNKTKLQLPDCSNLGYGGGDIVLSEHAKDCLNPYIGTLGSWIKLEFHDAPYWLFRLTNVVDALDESTSEIKCFPDGHIMRIIKFSFKPDAIERQIFFTLTQTPGKYQLATEAFIDLVHQYHLTGFSFKLLWDSDTGPVFGLPDYEWPRLTGLEPR